MKHTFVFVHGAWMSPLCWEGFVKRYQDQGHTCIAPAWPEGVVGIKDIVDHYAQIIDSLPSKPILIGHSFGGLFVQLLLDRGLGKAGISIDSAPPRGVLPGLNATRAGLPVLLTWGGWKKMLTMSFKNFQWGFAHTLPEAEQRKAYDKYVVPTSGKIYFQAVLGIECAIDFKNPNRAPLLLIAGEKDRTVEASMNRANFKKYAKSPAKTEFKEFPGRTHWLIGDKGWEEIADFSLAWAEKNVK